MKKVFLIDDDVAFRTMLEKLLEVHGFEVKSRDTPKKVLPEIVESNPDVILIDMNLPHKNGLELVTEIRTYQEVKDTPVILLTGDGKASTLKQAKKVGVQCFSKMETEPKQLIGYIKSLL